jgi:hypothetical protein
MRTPVEEFSTESSSFLWNYLFLIVLLTKNILKNTKSVFLDYLDWCLYYKKVLYNNPIIFYVNISKIYQECVK